MIEHTEYRERHDDRREEQEQQRRADAVQQLAQRPAEGRRRFGRQRQAAGGDVVTNELAQPAVHASGRLARQRRPLALQVTLDGVVERRLFPHLPHRPPHPVHVAGRGLNVMRAQPPRQIAAGVKPSQQPNKAAMPGAALAAISAKNASGSPSISAANASAGG